MFARYFRNFKQYAPDGAAGASGAPSGGAPSGGSPAGGGAPSGGAPSGGAPAGTPSPQSGAPGAQPGGAPGASGSPADQGPVPWERFQQVNTKAQALAWAEGMDPVTAREAMQLYEWIDVDPDGAYEYLTGVMRRTGRLPQSQNGHQGGQPQAGQFTDPQTGRPLPDILVRETGQRFYSAEQMDKLMAWRDTQQDQRLQRLEGTHAQQQARAEARSALQDAQQNWPQFQENVEAIFEALRQDRRLNLEGAYNRVVVRGGKLEGFYRTKMAEELRTNGQAGQGHQNPQGGAPAHSVDLSKLPMKELIRREMRRRGLGT